MKCWKCNTDLPDPPLGKLSFRALCDHCLAWLHSCKNCKNYQPGLPNNCRIPGTEFISDRESSNFCEEFDLLGQGTTAKTNLQSIEQQLFGNDENTSRPPKNFDSLFHDEN